MGSVSQYVKKRLLTERIFDQMNIEINKTNKQQNMKSASEQHEKLGDKVVLYKF